MSKKEITENVMLIIADRKCFEAVGEVYVGF